MPLSLTIKTKRYRNSLYFFPRKVKGFSFSFGLRKVKGFFFTFLFKKIEGGGVGGLGVRESTLVPLTTRNLHFPEFGVGVPPKFLQFS